MPFDDTLLPSPFNDTLSPSPFCDTLSHATFCAVLSLFLSMLDSRLRPSPFGDTLLPSPFGETLSVLDSHCALRCWTLASTLRPSMKHSCLRPSVKLSRMQPSSSNADPLHALAYVFPQTFFSYNLIIFQTSIFLFIFLFRSFPFFSLACILQLSLHILTSLCPLSPFLPCPSFRAY